ncbi:TetR/AcrR family transcriptional regulator [Hyalangium rubrum]|uniref:TetR/AcrR family transcriptional regulator n=1 Tax=Hyalangium rubrum TaxID=3103134 RepID=A0ABU5H9T6_9BACT|nr:TetR/AcrR family transcriptional regulator [Hyalangium sp. s54d21]MDY7229588.1 TetR/AcrR family transcriptional regulator [Hyalangium sp. s54d21]
MARPPLSPEAVQQQRERALRAAFVLFTRHGVESVSLRAVAQELEMSPMALYRYFPGGKGELLATLRGSGFEALAAELESAIVGVDDLLERLLRLTLALIHFATSQSALYRLMFDVTQEEEHDVYLATRRERAWRTASTCFAAAIRAGLLRGDPKTLPHVFFAAIHGVIAFEFSTQPDPDRRLSRLIGPMLETLFRGSGGSLATLRRVRRTFRASNPPPVTRRGTS